GRRAPGLRKPRKTVPRRGGAPGPRGGRRWFPPAPASSASRSPTSVRPSSRSPGGETTAATPCSPSSTPASTASLTPRRRSDRPAAAGEVSQAQAGRSAAARETGEVQLFGDRWEVAQVRQVSVHNQQLSQHVLDPARPRPKDEF